MDSKLAKAIAEIKAIEEQQRLERECQEFGHADCGRCPTCHYCGKLLR